MRPVQYWVRRDRAEAAFDGIHNRRVGGWTWVQVRPGAFARIFDVNDIGDQVHETDQSQKRW